MSTTAKLMELLRQLRRKHIECEDCWYSCPKSPEGCCNDNAGDDCDCGADRHNAILDEAVALLAAEDAAGTQARQGVAEGSAEGQPQAKTDGPTGAGTPK